MQKTVVERLRHYSASDNNKMLLKLIDFERKTFSTKMNESLLKLTNFIGEMELVEVSTYLEAIFAEEVCLKVRRSKTGGRV